MRRYHSIEIDLDDFDSDELIQELKERGALPNQDSDAKEILKALKRLKCPETIICEFSEWAHSPMPTPEKLQQWISFCTR